MTPRRWRLMAILWCVVVLALHSIPGAQLEQIPGQDTLLRSNRDKIAHAVLFAIFGILWWKFRPRRVVTILALGILYAIVLETYQELFISGRSGEPEDVLADTIGLALGLAAAVGVSRLYQPVSAPPTRAD